MRLPWALLVGALVTSVAADGQLVRRQDDSSSVSAAPADPTTSAAGSGQTSSSSDSGSDSTTAPATTSESAPSTTSEAESDTTVTRTTTVTNDNVDTVSRATTVLRTSTRTITVTSTDFSTTTVTSSDQATATKTVYVTSTSWANAKRAIDLSPRTIGPADVPASVTSVPAAFSTAVELADILQELAKPKRDGVLAKRATITEFVTVTAAGDDATTVFNTVTSTVVRTKTTDVTSTSVVTETEQADAKTTTTVTSTLVVTSTSITSGTTEPTSTETSGSDPNSDSSSSSSGSSGGLSTGAKAGIGAGVGVAGLVAIIALIWFLVRRRRNNPKLDPDAFIGASEVPVGGPVGGNTPPMSQHSAAAAAFLAPHRTPPKQSVSPEGYRGTAKGDGRTGYAKPAPYGAAYAQGQTPNRSSTLASNNSTIPGAGAGGDYLPEHPHPQGAELGDTAAARPAQLSPHAAELGAGGAGSKWHVTNAAEMDSQPATTPVSPATAATHSPPPADHVYEMPAQNYR